MSDIYNGLCEVSILPSSDKVIIEHGKWEHYHLLTEYCNEFWVLGTRLTSDWLNMHHRNCEHHHIQDGCHRGK